jgi:hypothetical protein
MGGGTDGQELGDALDEPEDDGAKETHEERPVMPEPPRGGKKPDEYPAGKARLSLSDPPEAGPRRPAGAGG